eukprot:augustus_masked-scaffold_28-processed-gene-4.105-mRNA-1 protein AED:1.00 eAED:1.00 QI:0/0/0/0/1/1/2/0/232
MKGAPVGWFNTPALFFERVISEIINADGVDDLFGAQSNGVIAWLDDLLVYSQSFEQLLIIFEKLLKQAAKKRVRVKENKKRIYWDLLYRWIIRLKSVDLVIFHISSRNNFVSDLLTRWAKEEEESSNRITRCSMDFKLEDEQIPTEEELAFEGQTSAVRGGEEELHKDIFSVDVSEVEFSEHPQYLEYERTLVNRMRRTVDPETNTDFQSRPISITTNYSEIKEFLFSEHIP